MEAADARRTMTALDTHLPLQPERMPLDKALARAAKVGWS